MNWSALEAKILAVVMKAMKSLNERWVTAEVRFEWDDETGHHCQGWIYPLYEIKEMIITGKCKELKETKDNIS